MNGNNKMIPAIFVVVGMLLMIVNAVILTSIVDGIVADTVAGAIADGRDNVEDWEGDESWMNSTDERAYYAYNIANIDAINSDASVSPEFELIGPAIYTVTTHREILAFDEDAGEMTYSEYDVFEWCENCTQDGKASVSGETELTNVNILYNTQKAAGLSTGITYGEIFAKAGFANAMMVNDLQNRAPSIWSAAEINMMVDGVAAQLVQAGYDEATASAMAPVAYLNAAYANWNASAGGASPMDPDFTEVANYILYDAVDPSTGDCIALTCDIGPMLAAGIGEPADETTAVRAALYGYSDRLDTTLIDWTVYALAGITFQSNGGGADLESAENLRERFRTASDPNSQQDSNNNGIMYDDGIDIVNADTLNYLLFGINEDTGLGAGLLTETDFNGIPLNGVALLLLGAQSDAFGTMLEYNVNLAQVLALADYAGGWIGMVGTMTEFEAILIGGQGTINADLWWQISFGSVEPLGGGYLSIGLNRADHAGDADLSLEKVREILYDGPFALTGNYAITFMYGELSGKTLPLGADGIPVSGGEQIDWSDELVAGMYGINTEAASALRSWVKDLMFDQVVGALLGFQYGTSPYTTQSLNNWLYGWRDIAVADTLGDINDMNLGWVSLETNMTYYGSDGVSTGDYSVYKMSTGSGPDGLASVEHRIAEGYISGETGEIYGMSEYLPWRSPAAEEEKYGLLTDHVGNADTSLNGTIGGIGDADESFKVNLVGYAIADSIVGDNVVYKGIPMVEHTVNLDPSTHQIQAKLLATGTILDVMPGGLPIYFGSTVDLKVEPVTNVVMYGKSVSRFYLDLRGAGSMNPDFGSDSSDVQPVFEIHTFSEISDEDAASFKEAVNDNMGPTYWTNFDSGADAKYIDYIAVSIYIISIVMMAFGSRKFMESHSNNKEE